MFTRLYLLLVGAGFIATATLGLFFPHELTGAVGISVQAVDSISEIRSNYGGMHLCIGLFILFAATTARKLHAALIFAILFTGGYTLGRLFSMVIDGVPSDTVLLLTGMEALGAILGIILLSIIDPED